MTSLDLPQGAASLRAYRAALLRFDPARDPSDCAVYDEDALLVIGPNSQGREVVLAAGPYAALKDAWAQVPTQHWPGRILAPGFVDMHIHYCQTDVIGSPAAGLLPWLETYTFPEEKRFSSLDHAGDVASFFVAETLRQGVTTALAFATSHANSVNALFEAAQAHNLRLITGLCLMDRNAPPDLLNQAQPGSAHNATEQSLLDTEALLQRWHGVGRLGYAITPRFAPTSTPEQLRGAGELAARYPDAWVQSHVSENKDEIAWVHQLFPQARSYLSVYDDAGLLRPRSVYAHSIHLTDDDRALMRERGAAAAVSPTSNLFLGSGFFDFEAAQRVGHLHGLASDVGGGTSFSPFHTMLAAYYVGREGHAKPGLSLTPAQLWWQHTAGAAQALGLQGVIGNLQVGCEADFVVLNPQATPLLARRTAQANSLQELLFAMIVLGDDRLIERTSIAQG